MKKLLVSLVAVVLLAGSVINVDAAGLKDIFSAKYYADQYPDLKAAFGYNEEMLWQHFLDYGLKEGRNMSPILDVKKYRAAYADLNQAFGDNWDAYVQHFFDYGVNENRDNGTNFDIKTYIAAYDDIKKAFGNDYAAVAEHYLVFGMAENRTKGDPAVYQAENKPAEFVGPTVTYDEEGRVIRVDYPAEGGGQYELYEYDEQGRIKTITTYVASDDSVQKWIEYEYDEDNGTRTIRGYEADGFMSWEDVYVGEDLISSISIDREGYKIFTEYDGDGFESKTTRTNPDGSISSIVFEYEDDKKTIYDYYDDGSYNVTHYENNVEIGGEEYNEEGELVVTITSSSWEDGGREYISTNIEGTVIRRKYVDANDLVRTQIYYDEYGEEGRKEEYIYDAAGELIALKETYGGGSRLTEYNEKGLIAKTTWYGSTDNCLGYEIYTYDENDRQIRSDYYYNDVLREYIIYVYDEDGNFLYENYYNADGTPVTA